MIECTEENFLELIQTKAVIHFWAPWCKLCAKVEQQLAQLESSFCGVVFAKANVAQLQGLAAQLGLASVPCIIAFEGGNEIARLAGFGENLLGWLRACFNEIA